MDNHVHTTNGRPLPEATGFSWSQVKEVEYQDANTGIITQACHAMIFARTNARLVSELPFKAWIMMQMRFDGKLGFPGGMVSDLGVPDSTLEDALNREMEEEINLDVRQFRFRREHHVVSHYSSWSNIIQNFYVQEVGEQEFRDIESHAWKAPEHGHESLGLIRVPLLTMHDGQSGFPCFIRNQFAGISLLQLMIGLRKQHIMSDGELQSCSKYLPKDQAFTALVDKATALNQALPPSFRGNQMLPGPSDSGKPRCA